MTNEPDTAFGFQYLNVPFKMVHFVSLVEQTRMMMTLSIAMNTLVILIYQHIRTHTHASVFG
jgi:hypothetical protein